MNNNIKSIKGLCTEIADNSSSSQSQYDILKKSYEIIYGAIDRISSEGVNTNENGSLFETKENGLCILFKVIL